jgi:hypothetical protein
VLPRYVAWRITTDRGTRLPGEEVQIRDLVVNGKLWNGFQMRLHIPAGVVEDVVPFPGHISQRRQAVCRGEARGIFRVAGKFDLIHDLDERAELGQLGWRESVEQHREAHVRVCSVVAEAIM